MRFLKRTLMDKCKYWYIEIYSLLVQEASICEVSDREKKIRMLSFRRKKIQRKGQREAQGPLQTLGDRELHSMPESA